MRMHRRFVLAILAACLAGPALAQAPPVRVRGTVVGLAGATLTIRPRTGDDLPVLLTPATAIVSVVPIDLAAIKPGSYIGTAAMPGPNGTLVAMEVHVFPEAMRGTGDGHRPYDLAPDSTMTNGTVGDVVGTTGRTMTVTYKGGQKTVQVPDDTPIVAFEPGARDQLVAGAHVILFTSKGADGAATATRVLVGKDGMALPL